MTTSTNEVAATKTHSVDGSPLQSIEAAAGNGTDPFESDPKHLALIECRKALDQTTRRLELARCQEAELEAWTLLSAVLLKIPPGNLSTSDFEHLPAGVQDACQKLLETTTGGMTSQPPPPDASNNGQWAITVHRSVQAYAIKRMAEIAQTIICERKLEGPALKESLRVLKQHQQRDSNLMLQIFDERLLSLRTYHAVQNIEPPSKKPRIGKPAADGYDLSAAVELHLGPLVNEETLFTPDEVLGKYLDLKSLFDQALHDGLLSFLSSNNKAPHYIDFLQALAKGRLEEFDRVAKRRKLFERFLQGLQSYLESHLQRTAPLLDVKQFRVNHGKEAESSTPTFDLSQYSSPEDLVNAVNPDQLKSELIRLGLKCGGTPLDRAKRLFLLKDVKSVDDLPKSMKKADSDSVENKLKSVQALLNQVQPVLEATIRKNERRQGQSLAERERELLEELYGTGTVAPPRSKTGDSDDDDDDDAPIYNPKNVPLDWDGKPMPYWLFKLHGLNHYYSCEICGGESYRGRRNFELHFAEQRHSSGMRSLGIPNTKHFHGVTSIDAARELWKTLQSKIEQDEFDASREEEYEDSHGNVLSRTKYEDLARQGLL